jgi:List-Bact-rpt repeat protein
MGRSRLFALALVCAAGMAGVVAAGGFAAKAATAGAAVPQGVVPWIPGDGQDEDGAYVDPSRPILHVHVYEHWAGSVEATNLEPGMINCPSACRRNVAAGTKVTLHETPTGIGYTFDHWTGATCEAPTTQTTRTCTITIPSSGETDLVAVYSGQYVPEPTPEPRQKHNQEASCEELYDAVAEECEAEPICEFFGLIYVLAVGPGCVPLEGGND